MLKEHIGECHGPRPPEISRIQSRTNQWAMPDKTKQSHPPISSNLFSFPVGFPSPAVSSSFEYPRLSKCELCGWYARCGMEMMNHKKIAHNHQENPFKI